MIYTIHPSGKITRHDDNLRHDIERALEKINKHHKNSPVAILLDHYPTEQEYFTYMSKRSKI